MSLGELLRVSEPGEGVHCRWRVLSGGEHVGGHVSLGELLRFSKCGQSLHLFWRVLRGGERG